MKIASLFSPILHRETFVLIGSQKDKEAYLKKRFGDALEGETEHELAGGAQFILVHGRKDIEFLWMPSHKLDDQNLALLAHEVLHLTCHRMRDLGVELNKGSEETFTHYFQYYFVNLLSIMRECGKKKK